MKGNADTVHRQLLRLVALLLALADVAERAAGRSHAVQRLVTWFLRHGEAVARDHVLALTGRAAHSPSPTMLPHSGAGEALHLAASFRALAAALSAFANTVAMFGIKAGHAIVDAGRAATVALAALAGPVCAVGRRDSS